MNIFQVMTEGLLSKKTRSDLNDHITEWISLETPTSEKYKLIDVSLIIASAFKVTPLFIVHQTILKKCTFILEVCLWAGDGGVF